MKVCRCGFPRSGLFRGAVLRIRVRDMIQVKGGESGDEHSDCGDGDDDFHTDYSFFFKVAGAFCSTLKNAGFQ